MEKRTVFSGEPAPGSNEMSVYDSEAIQAGITSLTLMERAGTAITARLLRNGSYPTMGKQILILCGPGNNGGDGLVIARKLLENGRPPLIVVAAASKYSEEFLVNLSRLSSYSRLFLFDAEEKNGMDLSLPLLDVASLEPRVRGVTLVVDALLGTGQTGPPRGNIKVLLERIETLTKPLHRLAVDVPTGVNATTGEAYPGGMPATETIAIQFPKRGMFQYPARRRCGLVHCVDIGIKASAQPEFMQLDTRSVLPIRRRKDAHKGQAGRVVVIGGNVDMPGAPFLSAAAAVHTGAGLVKIAVPRCCRQASFVPEAVFASTKSERELSAVDSGLLREEISQASVVILGPGLGLSANSRELVRRLLGGIDTPVVLDADGLNILAESQHEGGPLEIRDSWILTPHPGEFSRLSGYRTADIQKDRYGSFLHYSARSPAVLVLKGAGTLVGRSGRGWVFKGGNSFMATAGAGDVLCGIIAALVAQGLPPLEAAKLGVLVHGQAGDRAAGSGTHPIRALDIVTTIPAVIADHFEVI